jgi:hypothetical protein
MRWSVFFVFLAAVNAAAAATFIPPDGLIICDIPEALRVVRAADEVYVMPVRLTEERRRAEVSGTYTVVTPHGDYKHARRLVGDADRSLRQILGNKGNWFDGHDSTIGVGPEPKNVGYIFRKGKDQVVLLGYMRWRFDGTFNRAPTGGSLEEKASDKLDEWKKKYAKPELGIK